VRLYSFPHYYHNSIRSWSNWAGTDVRTKMAAEMVDLISAAEYRSTATSLSQCSQHIPEKEATIPNVQSTSPACRDRNGETGCGPASCEIRSKNPNEKFHDCVTQLPALLKKSSSESAEKQRCQSRSWMCDRPSRYIWSTVPPQRRDAIKAMGARKGHSTTRGLR